LVFVCSFNYL